MEPIGNMLDRAGEGNIHTAAVIEFGVVTTKISPVVAYVVLTVIRLRRCTEVTPIASNGRGHS